MIDILHYGIFLLNFKAIITLIHLEFLKQIKSWL
jgi:hypothetical protein